MALSNRLTGGGGLSPCASLALPCGWCCRAARDRAIKTYLDRDDDWDEEDEPEVKHELRQRPRVNYREVSGVDEQEDEDEEEEPRPKAARPTSWSCRRCTRDNELGATQCASCGSPRPRDIAAAVAAIPAAPSQNHASQPTPSSHLPPATVARADSPPTLESGDEAEFEDDQFVKQCKKIIRRLHDHEYGNLFVDEVTDEIAPGYSHIIKHPMCLRTLRQKLKSGKYQSSYAVSHCSLVVDIQPRHPEAGGHLAQRLSCDNVLWRVCISESPIILSGFHQGRRADLLQRRELQRPGARRHAHGAAAQGHLRRLGVTAHKVSAAASPQQPTDRPKRERERRELR